MFYSKLSDESIRHNISTGQFNVVKLDDNKEYNNLINTYPKRWHDHIKQAFMFNCQDMIKELVRYKVKETAF